MAQKVIGLVECPICGYDDQEVREDKNGKPYLVCDDCGCQIFARQARSGRIFREKAVPLDPGSPEEKGEPLEVTSGASTGGQKAPVPFVVAAPVKPVRSLLGELWHGTGGEL